jgi:thiamine-monophosphate kinase
MILNLCMGGEFDFIRGLREKRRRRATPAGLALGIGDDAAVIRSSQARDTVVTTDLLVEDVDFVRAASPPALLGHKSLAVSLSDIAAMGARPRWALISLGVPRAVWRTNFVDQFYEGFFGLADRYGVALIGGDVSGTPDRIVIDSIVLGETPRGGAIRRSGSKPGEYIYVTGALGGAAAGLKIILEKGGLRKRSSARMARGLKLRQLRPEPRVDWGLLLGEQRLATSMIDISDGLSSDLGHLCRESRIGGLIQGTSVPVDSRVTEFYRDTTVDPLSLALSGGEDFELLFTVRKRNMPRLPTEVNGVTITKIGETTAETEGIRITYGKRVKKLAAWGFDHFKDR